MRLTGVQSHRNSALAFAVLILHLPGCTTDWGTPYLEEGPLPLEGPGVTLTRYRQARHQGSLGRIERTLWSDGGTPADPMEFIDPLRDAIPERIREKLRQTTPRGRPGGQLFEQQDYYARATVVSLRPDVLILTIRESVDGEELHHPFQDFDPIYCERGRRERLERSNELIDCEGPPLCFYAGTLLPYSDEMYLVSTEPGVESRELAFDGNEAVVEIGDQTLRLSKSVNDVVATWN